MGQIRYKLRGIIWLCDSTRAVGEQGGAQKQYGVSTKWVEVWWPG